MGQHPRSSFEINDLHGSHRRIFGKKPPSPGLAHNDAKMVGLLVRRQTV
jgi:hypothetical protein